MAARSHRWMAWIWLPLLLTAGVRLGWLALIPTDPLAMVDAEGFHLLAKNVLVGRGFAIGWAAPFCPTAVRTPLYPLFLAGVYTLLGQAPERAVYAHVLLEVLTTAVVIALTRALARTQTTRSRARWLGMGAGLLYAFNGITQRYTGLLLSESLLLPVLTATLYLTIRFLKRPAVDRAALAGMAWGLAVLTKPNVQYLVVAVGGVVALRLTRANGSTGGWHRRFRTGLAFCIVLLVVLTPWVVRNRLVTGRWILSTAFEENIARVSAVVTMAELEGVAVEPWTPTWEHLYRGFVADLGQRRGWPELWVELLLDGTGPIVQTAGRLAVSETGAVMCGHLAGMREHIAVEARKLVAAHPWTYLHLHVRAGLRSLLDPGHEFWYHAITGREWTETGVVPDIWHRMGWSLVRWAPGDALRAFWNERLGRIPPLAGIIWWSLALGRALVSVLSLRGLWRLRFYPLSAMVLAGTVVYHLILPGPIAYDRFYVPVVPAVACLVVTGALRHLRTGN